VRGDRLRPIAGAAAALAASQLGHALVYYARFGPGASSGQSAGVHAYFPTLVALLSAGLGGVLMAGLVLAAATRSLGLGPVGLRARPTVRFGDLLPALFAVQLVVFMGQEAVEALAAGGPVPSVVELLFWGALGQLPAAVVGAAVLRWLLTRLEAVWAAFLAGAERLVDRPAAPALDAARPAPGAGSLRLLASAFPAAFRKRGPPLLLTSPAAS
jgi:hypothetical protein